VEEDPSQLANQPSSSPEKFHGCQDELCVQSSPYDNMDFLKKSRDFVDGYNAGLNRNPPGFDRSEDWLEGYCAALMKSKKSSSNSSVAANVGESNGSPTKTISRRPSPIFQQRGVEADKRADGRRPALAPIETNIHSMDSLKQAVFAPSNENAILTPAADGPHVNETAFNLGIWSKTHGSGPLADMPSATPAGNVDDFRFPVRTSSIKRNVHTSGEQLGPKNERLPFGHGTESTQGQAMPLQQTTRSGNEMLHPSRVASMSAKSVASSNSDMSGGARVPSITSIDSNLYRHWPGSRVFGPHLEYKSISSVAQHTGLASGFFAQAQFDGTLDIAEYTTDPNIPAAPKLTHAYPATGAPQTQGPSRRVMSNPNEPHASHFKEASLDGMSNPANSPPGSPPPTSPRGSPEKDKSKDIPTKSSPARAKFEQIAGKVGIKISNSGGNHDRQLSQGESSSSPNKRLWHGAWNRKKASKDEGGPSPTK
jgi:hypothetical protein